MSRPAAILALVNFNALAMGILVPLACDASSEFASVLWSPGHSVPRKASKFACHKVCSHGVELRMNHKVDKAEEADASNVIICQIML